MKIKKFGPTGASLAPPWIRQWSLPFVHNILNGEHENKLTVTSCSVADPEFPRGWGVNSPGAPTYDFAKISQKRIWIGGGARPKFYYVDPPLVFASLSCKWPILLLLTTLQYHIPVADPGFSRGGAAIAKLGLFCKFFAENCMTMKDFGPPGAGILDAPLDPPI